MEATLAGEVRRSLARRAGATGNATTERIMSFRVKLCEAGNRNLRLAGGERFLQRRRWEHLSHLFYGKNLAPREYFDLGLTVIYLHCPGNADHFSLKSDSPTVTRQFRPLWDVADESLIRVFCTEIKEDISIFAGIDGDD
jgi:hypothetical protein